MIERIKQNKYYLIISSFITVLPILAGIILWDKLPEQIAVHFAADGTADGFESKSFAVFVLPLFLLALHLLCFFGVHSDPNNKHGQNTFILKMVYFIVPVISLVTNGAIYLYALNISVDIRVILTILISVLFILIGNYLPKVKHNYTLGVKLPWTLKSEENWNKTHRLAGKVWVIGGISILLTVFLPSSFFLPIIPSVTAIMVIIPTIYSYIIYTKEDKNNN